MKESSFNIEFQHTNTQSKIVAGLSRISEAYRALLWEHAKVIGLSPIQIQILIFIAYHTQDKCNVSHLAKEFNVTKPTVSDAIKVLEKKKLIKKVISETDKRAYSISLTKKGKGICENIEHFANPIKTSLSGLDKTEEEQLFLSLSKLIFGLNRAGVLEVQRVCYGCRFYEKKETHHYCHFMEKDLLDRELRLDCEEFEKQP